MNIDAGIWYKLIKPVTLNQNLIFYLIKFLNLVNKFLLKICSFDTNRLLTSNDDFFISRNKLTDRPTTETIPHIKNQQKY